MCLDFVKQTNTRLWEIRFYVHEPFCSLTWQAKAHLIMIVLHEPEPPCRFKFPFIFLTLLDLYGNFTSLQEGGRPARGRAQKGSCRLVTSVPYSRSSFLHCKMTNWRTSGHPETKFLRTCFDVTPNLSTYDLITNSCWGFPVDQILSLNLNFYSIDTQKSIAVYCTMLTFDIFWTAGGKKRSVDGI